MKLTTSKSPAVIKMSCHNVIPIPATTGVRVKRNEEIAAIFGDKITYAKRVTAKTSSNPLMRVRSPMACPCSEKSLTYNAHDAVKEFVSSPDFAIWTAPKESPEKNPGKKIIHQVI